MEEHLFYLYNLVKFTKMTFADRKYRQNAKGGMPSHGQARHKQAFLPRRSASDLSGARHVFKGAVGLCNGHGWLGNVTVLSPSPLLIWQWGTQEPQRWIIQTLTQDQKMPCRHQNLKSREGREGVSGTLQLWTKPDLNLGQLWGWSDSFRYLGGGLLKLCTDPEEGQGAGELQEWLRVDM